MDSLAPDIDRMTELLAAGREALEPCRRLGASLCSGPAAALPRSVTTLVIVPDGALHRVPFDALLLPGGARLFERFATSVVPSAAVALALWQRAPRPGPTALLAFGDPAFPGEGQPGDGAEVLRSAFAASGGLPRLRASGAEARHAAAFADRARLLLRGEASESALKHSPLESFHVIHFATHALVDETSAARTALALAAGAGEDGFVGPADLAALSLRADLVVLSACRTAGGRLVRGEGLQGLTAPLLAAGARSLIASQWPIRDRATGKLMDRFYRALAAGETVAEALRAARMDMLRSGEPPSQWAAFTLVGDPTVRIALRRPAAPRWPWALGAALALLAGGLAVARARRPYRTR